MRTDLLLVPILVPFFGGLACLLLPKRMERLGEVIFLLAALTTAVMSALLFKQDLSHSISLGAFGFTLDFKVDALNSFIFLSSAILAALVAIYTATFMRGKSTSTRFMAYFLLTLTSLSGAVLASHLLTLLFFWEGMLLTLFGMIYLGHKNAYPTAVKAFFIGGVTDLCMMIGIGLTLWQARTGTFSSIHLSTEGVQGLAYVMLMIGAVSKAGAMPFHSWIPDAAMDAPLPFMALMPAVLEKLMGIYFLARISLEMFTLGFGWASTLVMTIGAATILLAVLMALVQKDFKRLLSFHAVSQVGYMILGIGTGVPAGVVGGLFHTVNHTMYKSTLFLSGGAVEKQAGTTDLRKIGGLWGKMPITAVCFIIAAAAISGVPPFNGYFSKELVYDGAAARHFGFYLAAALGSFFTAASFLKLGHAAFFGSYRAPKADVKEAPLTMLVPMGIIAALCILFGVYHQLPLRQLVQPALANVVQGQDFSGYLPHASSGWVLVAMTALMLGGAVANHWWGVKQTGSGLGAVDHIHYAPGAHQLYDLAEKRVFDPYVIMLRIVDVVAWIGWATDRALDYFYNRVVTGTAAALASLSRESHSGSHATYLLWSVLGASLVIFYLVRGF